MALVHLLDPGAGPEILQVTADGRCHRTQSAFQRLSGQSGPVPSRGSEQIVLVERRGLSGDRAASAEGPARHATRRSPGKSGSRRRTATTTGRISPERTQPRRSRRRVAAKLRRRRARSLAALAEIAGNRRSKARLNSRIDQRGAAASSQNPASRQAKTTAQVV